MTRYMMRSGVLYSDRSVPLGRIKSDLAGPSKNVLLPDGTPVLKTDIRTESGENSVRSDVRCNVYTMADSSGRVIASARPDYAEGEDPDVMGWPVCRLPQVDNARITAGELCCTLTMHNSQLYSLQDADGAELLRVMHKGLSGGWVLEDRYGFSPEILCGLFIFCRYIERENEFLTV